MFDILADTPEALGANAFVTFGEVMVRDTPADGERLERTRRVDVSLAGSEYSLAIALQRLGLSSSFITRVPDNPYGWQVRDIARSMGVNTEHFCWAPQTEPIGRFLYELGRTPRPGAGWYQRMHSAASKLGAGMVDWEQALAGCRLFHTSGISFGLARHSGYARNYLLEAFNEAMVARPTDCLVGLDYNYRSTLWGKQEALAVMTPILEEQVDILITSIVNIAGLYDIGIGQYSPQAIVNGDLGPVSDDDLQVFMRGLLQRFGLRLVALTLRYPDSFEQHRWESAAMDAEGHFYRSPAVRSITLLDRLGGGDAWNAGFYYGLLTETGAAAALQKGVLVGDAASCLKQTMMFDLPVVTREEVQALLASWEQGGGKRTVR